MSQFDDILNQNKILLAKLYPFFILSCTTCLAVILGSLRGRKDIGQFNKILTANRDAIPPVIQVLSSTLGIAQISAVCSLFNFATRLRLWATPTKLEAISFWSALSIPRLDFALPFHLSAILVYFLLASNIAGAIGAGSLTPKYMNLVKEIGSIQVAEYILISAQYSREEYTENEDGMYGSDSNCALNHTSKTIISSHPSLDLFGRTW
jgi:hypothetical protein